MSLSTEVIKSLKNIYPSCVQFSDQIILQHTKAMIDAWCSGITKLKKDNIVIETDYDGKHWYIYDLDKSKSQTQRNTDPTLIPENESSKFIDKITQYISNGFIHIEELTPNEKNWYSKEINTWEHQKFNIFN